MNKTFITFLLDESGRKSPRMGCIGCSALEVQRRGADDDLADVHIGWLLDGVSDRASDRVGRNSYFVELTQILSGGFIRTAFGQLRSNRGRRDNGATNVVGLVLQTQTLGQGSHGEFSGTVYGAARRKDFKAGDRCEIDDVTQFLFLHDG